MNRRAPFPASLIAKWLIDRAQRSEDHDVDNLKLQKLLYFAQSRYLHLAGVPLIRESFHAWKLGPVVPALWQEFRDTQGPIRLDLAPDGPWHDLPAEAVIVLDETWAAFGVYSGWRLSDLTHEVGPWALYWSADERNVVIPTDAIRDAWSEFARHEAKPATPDSGRESVLAKYRLLARQHPVGERVGDPSLIEEELLRTEALRKEATTLLQ